MSEESKQGVNAQTPKKLRRGVSNQTQAVAQLKFHEKDAAPNGLFTGHLEEVSVQWSVNADGKIFTGMKMPRLSFHFASEHPSVNERRHVYHNLIPIESNVDTIPGGKSDWQVNALFRWIKHMLDVFYLKGRPLTEAEEDALALPFEDFTEDEAGNIEYVPVEPETVLAGYATLFNNVAAMLNGTFGTDDKVGKPCYKDANGKFIPLWLKLLRHKKTKNSWINVSSNGDLAFDGFIGAGAIEIRKPNTPPSILFVDFSKESITPKEVKKEPTIGNVALPGAVPIAGPTPMGSQFNSGAFAAAAEDMPF